MKHRKRISNWPYHILETTPILHDPTELRRLYRLASTDFQKSCIMYHILRFEQHTMKFKSYRSLYNKIYDEFAS